MLNEVKSRKAGRKIIPFMHLSLDGFVAGPEMNRIKVDEEIFDHVGKRLSGVSIVHRWRGADHRTSYFTNGGGL